MKKLNVLMAVGIVASFCLNIGCAKSRAGESTSNSEENTYGVAKQNGTNLVVTSKDGSVDIHFDHIDHAYLNEQSQSLVASLSGDGQFSNAEMEVHSIKGLIDLTYALDLGNSESCLALAQAALQQNLQFEITVQVLGQDGTDAPISGGGSMTPAVSSALVRPTDISAVYRITAVSIESCRLGDVSPAASASSGSSAVPVSPTNCGTNGRLCDQPAK